MPKILVSMKQLSVHTEFREKCVILFYLFTCQNAFA
jgi:hypothetical protein